jgi:hypothetical protein
MIFMIFTNAMPKFTNRELLEGQQRDARVLLQELSSLQCAHSLEVQEEVGFLTSGATGEFFISKATFFEKSGAILLVCVESVPSVGIVAFINTRALLDELPSDKS